MTPLPDALRVPVTEEQLGSRRLRVDTSRRVRLRKEVSAELTPVRVPLGQVVDAWPRVGEEGEVTVVPMAEPCWVTRKELVPVEVIRFIRRTEFRRHLRLPLAPLRLGRRHPWQHLERGGAPRPLRVGGRRAGRDPG